MSFFRYLFFDIFRVKMLLLLSKACALNEHRQKETNLEMLVENARFQRNAQPFLGFLILPRVFWFFRESFGFTWAIWFCRKLFGFAESFSELFGFAVSYLVLSLAFWFFRELFGFALSFLVFLWAIWFRRELFGFVVSFLVFPWAFLVFPWAFWFFRELFDFAISPWAIWFYHNSCGPPY